MIIEELLEGTDLIRRYSDQGFLLMQDQTGEMYEDPVDLVTSEYTYTETDIPANQPEPEEPDEPDEPEPIEDDNEELNVWDTLSILLGGEAV